MIHLCMTLPAYVCRLCIVIFLQNNLTWLMWGACLMLKLIVILVNPHDVTAIPFLEFFLQCEVRLEPRTKIRVEIGMKKENAIWECSLNICCSLGLHSHQGDNDSVQSPLNFCSADLDQLYA